MAAEETPAVAVPTPLGTLLAWTRPYRFLLWSCLAAAAVSAVLSIAPMVVLYAFAERVVTGDRALGPIFLLAGAGLAAVLLQLVLASTANRLGHRLAFAVQKDLRLAMIDRITRMPASVLEGRAGQTKKVVLDDTGQLEGLLAHVLPDLTAGVAAFLAGCAVLAMIDWRFLPAALALLPLAYLAQRWTYRGSTDVFVRWSAAEAEANRSLLAYVRGIATLKAFDRLASTLESVSGAVRLLRDLSNAITRRSSYPYALFNAALATNLVFVLPLALHLAATGRIGVPEFVLVVALGSRLTAPLVKVVLVATVLSRAEGGLARIRELLDAPVIADDGRGDMPAGNTLRLEGVEFSYPGDETGALRGVDLVIPERRLTAIVGPSGAGKSTLVRLLPRIDDVGAGRITLGGTDIRDVPLAALRQRFGVVLQKPTLYPGSVRDNVALSRPDADDETIASAAAAARIDALLANDDDRRVGEVGARLSGGERQRIDIARVVLKDAPILILDEATAFVDPHGEAKIQEAIAAAASGRTLVVVAHRLATVRQADQIVVMRDGRVEATGHHNKQQRASPTNTAQWYSQATPTPLHYDAARRAGGRR